MQENKAPFNKAMFEKWRQLANLPLLTWLTNVLSSRLPRDKKLNSFVWFLLQVHIHLSEVMDSSACLWRRICFRGLVKSTPRSLVSVRLILNKKAPLEIKRDKTNFSSVVYIVQNTCKGHNIEIAHTSTGRKIESHRANIHVTCHFVERFKNLSLLSEILTQSGRESNDIF